MEEKIEIINLLQSKQILENELQLLAYGSVEIRENNSNKYECKSIDLSSFYFFYGRFKL